MPTHNRSDSSPWPPTPMQSQRVQKLHGTAFELSTGLKIGANRAGPRPGPFPSHPGAGLGREAAKNQRCPVLPPRTTKNENPFDCIGANLVALSKSIGPSSRAPKCQRLLLRGATPAVLSLAAAAPVGANSAPRSKNWVQRRSRPQDRHLRSMTLPWAPRGSIVCPRTEDFASRGPRNLSSGGTPPQIRGTLYVGHRCTWRQSGRFFWVRV